MKNRTWSVVCRAALAAGLVGFGWTAVGGTNEPAPHGRRINLGCYGGTEWATGPRPGLMLIVR